MSDSLQKLIKEMEEPLSSSAIKFLKLYDKKKPEFFTASFEDSTDPFRLGNGEFKFELTYTPPQLVEFTVPWSPKFESELYRRHIKMASPEQEAIRGGFLLLSNLKFSGIKFGEDYTNAVLVELIKERFGTIDVIRNLLEKVREYNPSKGNSYLDCKNYLKSAINGYGNSLVLELKYKDSKAFIIMVAAIVVLIDKRFRISLRETLFPK